MVAEVSTTGTLKAPLGALKPSGKSATTHAIDVLDMKDGKVARITSYRNMREVLLQYDATTPAPPPKK